MFAVPNAKRIKRSHLFRNDDSSEDSPASSRSASPAEPESDAHDDVDVSYGFEYEFVAPRLAHMNATPASEAHPLDPAQEEDEPEYQFRLFAPGPKVESHKDQLQSATTDVKIRLSATPEPTELAESLSLDKAHFVRPNRPDEYYFTSALPEETIIALRSQYEDAATSSSEILLRAKSTKWPGTALPWRLIKVELLNKPSKSTTPKRNEPAKQKASARPRPSKKCRVLFRRRLALRSELAAQSKITEETEREKRTRRNREKKVKKKEREKRKKSDAEEVDDGTVLDTSFSQVKSQEMAKEGSKGRTETPTEASRAGNFTPSGVVQTNTDDADTQKHTESSSTGRASTAIAAPAVAMVQRALGIPPTRRAPTSRAPTAPATGALPAKAKAYARAPTSTHPTRS